MFLDYLLFQFGIIAIDGEILRASKDTFHKKSALHIVSAWARGNQLALGQRKIDGKSNEIPTIPALLERLNIAGSIITIEAMGTQKDITEVICENQASCILALKGNQPYSKDDAESLRKRMKPDTENAVVEKGHGRIETRNCKVYNQVQWLEDLDMWRGFKSPPKERLTGRKQVRPDFTFAA